MAQFYNDKINNSIDKNTQFLKKKDAELNDLLISEFNKYTDTFRLIPVVEFNKKFDKIYILTPEIEKIFNAQNKKNMDRMSNEMAEIKGVDVKEVEVKTPSINAKNEEFLIKIQELKRNSYVKLNNMCVEFKTEFDLALIESLEE